MYCSSHLFPIHIIYALISPIIRDPGPRYKWVGKSLTCNKQVGFKALCNKASRPRPHTDKGSSSITDNMITLSGIYVLNFKFKRYSL